MKEKNIKAISELKQLTNWLLLSYLIYYFIFYFSNDNTAYRNFFMLNNEIWFLKLILIIIALHFYSKYLLKFHKEKTLLTISLTGILFIIFFGL